MRIVTRACRPTSTFSKAVNHGSSDGDCYALQNSALSVVGVKSIGQWTDLQQTFVTSKGALLTLQPVDVTVGLKVQCVGAGLGFVSVTVHQDSPPATLPTGADGAGGTDVVCDGQQRQVAVSVGGDPGFNLGDASATATLMVDSSIAAIDAKPIKIVLR